MCCGAKFGFVGLLFSLFLGPCCPPDPPVTVTLAVDPTPILADGGTATLTASLAAAHTEDLQLTLAATQTPAGDPVYQLSAAQITIAAGATEGSVTVTALALPQDVDSASIVFRIAQISTGTCSWEVDILAEALVIEAPGALQVLLEPAKAVTATAQWNLDGGAWQEGGAIISDLAPGVYTVNYKDIPGWTAPPSEQVTIVRNQTTVITGTYTPLPNAL